MEKKDEGRERERSAVGELWASLRSGFFLLINGIKRKSSNTELESMPATRFQLLSHPKFNGAKGLSQSIATIRNAAIDHWVSYYI